MANRFVWTKFYEEKLINEWNKVSLSKMASDFGCSISTLENKALELGLPEYKSNRWTKEEVELLKEYSTKYVTKTIAKKLGKSVLAVQKKANKLGIELHSKKDPWKKWMIDYLKDNINKIPIRKITEMTGMDYHSIIKKCNELGIEVESNRWTKKEIQILKDNASKYHYTELTKLLPGRSAGAIAGKAFDLGIELISDYYDLNEEDGNYVKEHWGKMPITQIARNLKVTVGIIYRYKNEYNLPNVGQQKKWDEKTIEELRVCAKTMSKNELSKKFNTSTSQLTTIASKNNIKLISDRKIIWTEDKVEELMNHYNEGLNITEISEVMDLKQSQVRAKLGDLNLQVKRSLPKNAWSKKQSEELIDMYDNYTIEEISNKLGKEKEDVIKQVKKLKLDSTLESKKYWTKEDDELLKSLFDKEVFEIVGIMGFSEGLVRKKAKKMGIKLKNTTCKRWTKKEEELLVEYAKTMDIKTISKKLGRTCGSITSKLKYIDAEHAKSNRFWTEDETNELIRLSKDHTAIEIAVIMNKDYSSVRMKLSRLNIKTKNDYCKKWTKEEEDEMIKLLEDHSTKEASYILGRSEEQVILRARKLGYLKHDVRPWTKEDEKLLRDMWGNSSIENICKKLNRTSSSIIDKVHQLNLGSTFINNYDGITISDLEIILNEKRNIIQTDWVSLGLIIDKRRISKYRDYAYVTIPNLLEFLKNNQEIWNSNYLEKNILGEEPDWLLEKRKRDIIKTNDSYTFMKQKLISNDNYYVKYEDNEDEKEVLKKKK